MRDADRGADGRNGETAGLPEAVRDVVVRLARTVQRVSLYPPGHPALESAAREMVDYLTEETSSGGPLELAVAPDRILVGDRASEPGHPQIRNLAERLHEHGVARVTFMPGLEAGEVEDFLGELGRRPNDEAGRLGEREDVEERWRTIWVKPLRYERLALAGDGPDAPGPDEDVEGGGAESDDVDGTRRAASAGTSHADRLWKGLAHAVFSDGSADDAGAGGGSDDAARDADGEGQDVSRELVLGPEDLAAALDRHSREATLAEAVTRELVHIARELAVSDREEGARRSADGEEASGPPTGATENPDALARKRQKERLRGRFGTFFRSLKPDTVRRLVREGVDRKGRAELLTYGSVVLPPLAVVELVEAAAEEGDLDASPWMLRLIRKLADHASGGTGSSTASGRQALEAQIREIVGETDDDDSRPTAYARALRAMSDEDRVEGSRGARALRLEPLRVVQMALEVDALGESGNRAVELLLEDGGLGELLGLLDEAPAEGEVASRLWDRLDPEASVRELLEEEPPDLEGLEVLAGRLGVATAPPLLEALAESESRSVRRALFSLLAGMGEPLAPVLVDRLDPEEPWFINRNLLALLVELEAGPEGFSARAWAEHDHPSVRREAYRLMLRDPGTRTDGIRMALAEKDSKLASLGMAAVEADESREVLSLVVDQVQNDSLSPRIRRLGVKALERDGSDRSRKALVDLCLRRRLWTFWRRDLVPPDAVTVAAVEALARQWPRHPEAARVVRLARESEHREYREAAG